MVGLGLCSPGALYSIAFCLGLSSCDSRVSFGLLVSGSLMSWGVDIWLSRCSVSAKEVDRGVGHRSGELELESLG